MVTSQIMQSLAELANPVKAKALQRFFKTGKGEYGHGDIFLGITVPEQRRVAKQFADAATFADAQKLLKSKIHEHRFTALEILVMQYETANNNSKKEIFKFYLTQTKRVNNWDLVDTSAPYIVGDYLHDKKATLLHALAKSENVWERRIAIVATYGFIKHGRFSDTLQLARILTNDTHDLIHKAVGWMLREVGKKDIAILEQFLDAHAPTMPRTALRYAIERFPKAEQQHYLKLKRA